MTTSEMKKFLRDMLRHYQVGNDSIPPQRFQKLELKKWSAEELTDLTEFVRILKMNQEHIRKQWRDRNEYLRKFHGDSYPTTTDDSESKAFSDQWFAYSHVIAMAFEYLSKCQRLT